MAKKTSKPADEKAPFGAGAIDEGDLAVSATHLTLRAVDQDGMVFDEVRLDQVTGRRWTETAYSESASKGSPSHVENCAWSPRPAASQSASYAAAV